MLLVVRPGATFVASLLLVPFATSSILAPGATFVASLLLVPLLVASLLQELFVACS